MDQFEIILPTLKHNKSIKKIWNHKNEVLITNFRLRNWKLITKLVKKQEKIMDKIRNMAKAGSSSGKVKEVEQAKEIVFPIFN